MLTCHMTKVINKKKKSFTGSIQTQFFCLGEDAILPLFLIVVALRRKGKVQWDNTDPVPDTAVTQPPAEPTHTHVNPMQLHVILNLQHHPSERRRVFPQMNDLNQKTSPVARDTYGHHSQEQLSSTSPAHFPLCNVRGCSVKRMTL